MMICHKSIIFKLFLSLILSTFLISFTHVYADTSANTLHYPCLFPTSNDRSTTPLPSSTASRLLENNTAHTITNKITKTNSTMPENQMLNMTIVLNMRNQDQFNKCLASINDPKSPNYHHFLNDTTILPYLVTPGYKSSIVSFFKEHDFKVMDDGTSPLVLKISAPIRNVERTFVVTINVYNTTVNNFQIPTANPVINKEFPNNEFTFSQSIISYPHNTGIFYAPDSAPALPENIANLVGYIDGLDNYTSVQTLQSPCSGPYCPAKLQTAYSFSTLYNNGFNGSGTNVAVVGCAGDPNPENAMYVYDHQFQLPPVDLHIYHVGGNTTNYDPSWAGETMMDVQAIHTVAPGAAIHLIYVNCNLGSPMDGIDYVATHHIANIVSNSWSFMCSEGPCSDTQLPSSLVQSNSNRIAIDVAKGLTILFASGDNGATPDGTNVGTEFPASDPNVLAVGATDLTLLPCVNLSCSDYTESGSKISGGGYSGYFAEPSWQVDNIGTKTGRAVPDVSILGYAPALWVYSTNSTQCGHYKSKEGFFGCSGTSLSTPLWAGYLALMTQKSNMTSLGNVAPYLYNTYNNTNNKSFNDIISGNNNFTGKGYSAQGGWDPVTGLGTPIPNKFLIIPEFPFASTIVMFLAFFVLVLVSQIRFKKLLI